MNQAAGIGEGDAASGAPPVRVTAGLGEWVSGLTATRIPPEIHSHMKSCLLDSLGCGLYGAAQPWGRIAAEVAVGFSGGGPASLLGRSQRASPSDAAMANGTAIHGFEMDDLHVAGMCHPGAVTVPAALAAAEAIGASGPELLVSLIAGYETGIRVGLCAGIKHATSGYHAAGTAGTLCSSAAVARLLRLDGTQATNALGIGATQAAGLYSARMGAMSKRFHAGRAAQSGVMAGYLAARGFTGSDIALEAPFGGFMSTMNGQNDPATILEGLGEHWETGRVGFKIYASCGSSHTTVDALHELMQQGLRADNLSHLRVRMTGKALANVGWPYKPAGVVSAQMNGYYVAAVKLLDGDAFLDQFKESRIADPAILDLIPRIELAHDPELDQGGAAKRHAVRVDAELTDGSRLQTYVEQRRGSAERPLPYAEVERKFRMLAAVSLPPQTIDRIVELVADLDKQAGVGPLAELLRVG